MCPFRASSRTDFDAMPGLAHGRRLSVGYYVTSGVQDPRFELLMEHHFCLYISTWFVMKIRAS